MFIIRTTWAGPADKLYQNGEFFKIKYMDGEKLAAFLVGFKGVVKLNPMVMYADHVVTETVFDTEENATLSGLADPAMEAPADVFFDRPGFISYIHTNGITRSAEIVPA